MSSLHVCAHLKCVSFIQNCSAFFHYQTSFYNLQQIVALSKNTLDYFRLKIENGCQRVPLQDRGVIVRRDLLHSIHLCQDCTPARSSDLHLCHISLPLHRFYPPSSIPHTHYVVLACRKSSAKCC